MKKIIAAMLSALVGLFGYTIVDTAIENRVSNLESEVSMLRSQVAEYHATTAQSETTRWYPTTTYPYETTTEASPETTTALGITAPTTIVEYSATVTYPTTMLPTQKPLTTEYVPTTSGVKYEGYCGDNAKWSFYYDGTLIISGNGYMFDGTAEWYGYRNSVKQVIIHDGITSIGEEAFYNCSRLTSIDIPDSVRNIGDAAFMGCSSLASVEIPVGVTSIGYGVFYGCSSLTSIVIPDGVQSIGVSAIRGCSSLTSIVIPDSVTEIDMYAFSACSSLTDVYYAGTEAEWNEISIDGEENANARLTDANIHYNYTA